MKLLMNIFSNEMERGNHMKSRNLCELNYRVFLFMGRKTLSKYKNLFVMEYEFYEQFRIFVTKASS